MLKTRLIPCMLFNGIGLVKTISFSQLRNLGNAVQAARVYNNRNDDELFFIDITATQEKRHPMYEIISDIVQECFMPLTIGGGIHTVDDISQLLRIGADKVSINSEAVSNPDFVNTAARKFGSQCIVVSIDARKIGGEYHVFTNRGSQQTEVSAVSWAREVEVRGAGEILLTSIDNDGTMSGYDLDLIRSVTAEVSIPVIACGGAGQIQDIIDAVQIGNASAASLASMFHYAGHTSNSIKVRMLDAGIPVRNVTSDILVNLQ